MFKHKVRMMAKRILKPLIYAYPPVGLQPERLMVWLDTLAHLERVEGDVLEIGCNVGGTAAVSARMLQRLGSNRKYICIDTFSGFVSQQFDKDVALGNVENNRGMFSSNTEGLTRWVLNHHKAGNVELIKSDICAIAADDLPESIAACLIDVDLAEPVQVALQKVYPILSPGGSILIDDCPEHYAWKARLGYQAFMREKGLQTDYRFGMGIVAKASYAGEPLLP